MLGSIIGDIVGSIYEFSNIKTKNFPFWGNGATYTDDSILTIATANWLLRGGTCEEYYVSLGKQFPCPMGGYGGGFERWLFAPDRLCDYDENGGLQSNGERHPYNSCGNGSAMRVGPVGWAFDTEREVLEAAKVSAECTHNHPEGIKGAQATALCIFLGRKNVPKSRIRETIQDRFGYNLSYTVDELRARYSWKGMDGLGNGGTCQDSVPQAIICALDAISFEDAIRNAISIGGDSDTIGCITGSIAEVLYGVPQQMRLAAFNYLPKDLADIVMKFESKFSFSCCNPKGVEPERTIVRGLPPLRDFNDGKRHISRYSTVYGPMPPDLFEEEQPEGIDSGSHACLYGPPPISILQEKRYSPRRRWQLTVVYLFLALIVLISILFLWA